VRYPRNLAGDGPEDRSIQSHDKMVSLVEKMLDLHRRLSESKTCSEKTILSRQIEATDRQIDGLVYELYGLTEEEIAIVEDAARLRRQPAGAASVAVSAAWGIF